MVLKVFVDIQDLWPLVAALSAHAIAVMYVVRRGTQRREEED